MCAVAQRSSEYQGSSELRRIPIPRTRVNKGKKKGQGSPYKPWPLRLSLYGFCPGGALPAGFWFSEGTPFAWPFGVLPPPFSFTGVILANATPLSDMVSATTTAVTNNVIRFLIFSPPFPLSKNKRPASKDHNVIPSVAGCTTGSLCPRCPYIRDEVLSLY